MGKKLLWKVLPMAFLAGVGSTAFTSCADEYDPAKITREDILKENYAKNWEEVFGTPDPNQDWSMAQLITANVDLGVNTNGVVKIYSGAPNALGTTLLAEEILSDGKATFTFDALKGASFVCARIESGNSVVKSGVYDIVNGKISIGKAATRANTDDPCTVTKTAFDYSASRLKPATVAALQNSSYDNYQDLVDNDPNAGNYALAIDMGLITENVPNLYVLNDVDFTRHDDGYTYTELRPIFADYINKNAETVGGAFKEGVDHIAQYVSYGEMETNVTFQVKEDGPVEMDCIWRGTQLNDFFGYYYYTGNEPTAEELWNIKKYILIGNSVTGSSTNWIKDTSSLTQKKESGSADWVDLDGMGIPLRYNSPNPASDDVNKLRGTILRLVYFGADGNGSASYNFPAGTKIGFFMVDTNNTAKFFYSQSRENYQLERRLYTPAGTPNSSWLAQQTANKNQYGAVEGPNARPFAASFSYDGRVYLGFGDESGDCDMNDLVFITSNVVPPSNDITPDDLSKAESVSWLVACEDLGGTYDYDFNDLVFEINREKAKSTDETYSLYLTPMAAGGTLPAKVYYNNELVGEIHSLLGGTNTSSIINATYGQTPRIGSKILLSSSLAEADKDIATILGKIKVVVSQNAGDTDSQVVIQAYKKDETATNSAPQLILLPGGWDWPSETTPITSVYPNFVQWTSDVTYTTWDDEKSDGSKFIVNPRKVATGGGNSGSGSGSDPSLANPNLTLSSTATMTFTSLDTQVYSYTTDSDGAVTATAPTGFTVTVDQENKTVTVVPNKKGNFSGTVTLSQAATAEYNSANASFGVSCEISLLAFPVGVETTLTSSLCDNSTFASDAFGWQLNQNPKIFKIDVSDYAIPVDKAGTLKITLVSGDNNPTCFYSPSGSSFTWGTSGYGDTHTFELSADKVSELFANGGFYTMWANISSVTLTLNE